MIDREDLATLLAVARGARDARRARGQTTFRGIPVQELDAILAEWNPDGTRAERVAWPRRRIGAE
jgi:hypothetical protein